MDEDTRMEVLVGYATSFLDWVMAQGDRAMRAAVSSSLQRATLALQSPVFEVVWDGKEAVCYLRSLACQAHFVEVECLLDCLECILVERLLSAPLL